LWSRYCHNGRGTATAVWVLPPRSGSHTSRGFGTGRGLYHSLGVGPGLAIASLGVGVGGRGASRALVWALVLAVVWVWAPTVYPRPRPRPRPQRPAQRRQDRDPDPDCRTDPDPCRNPNWFETPTVVAVPRLQWLYPDRCGSTTTTSATPTKKQKAPREPNLAGPFVQSGAQAIT